MEPRTDHLDGYLRIFTRCCGHALCRVYGAHAATAQRRHDPVPTDHSAQPRIFLCNLLLATGQLHRIC